MQAGFCTLESASLENSWAQALAWTLLNSLWVAACAALVLLALLRLLPARRARLRCGVSTAALLIVPLLAALTLWRERITEAPPAFSSFEPGQAELSWVMVALDSLRQAAELLRALLARRLAPFDQWIVTVWSVCALLALVRLAGGWIWLQQDDERHMHRAAARLQAKLASLGRRVGLLQRVPLYWSTTADVPMVIGVWRPRIVIPAAFKARLESGALDAVLLHELAHVRRNDVRARCLEAMLQAVFVLNPALQWICSRVAREREHRCDDMALEAGAERLGYVRALAALEAARATRRACVVARHERQIGSAHALRATDGALLERIRRLTDSAAPASRDRGLFAGSVLLFGCTGLALGAVPTHASVSYFVAEIRSSTGDALEFEGQRVIFVAGKAPIAGSELRVEKLALRARTGVRIDAGDALLPSQPVELQLEPDAGESRRIVIKSAIWHPAGKSVELRVLHSER